MRSRTFLAGSVAGLLLVGSAGASVVAAGDATVPETPGTMVLTQSTTLTADHVGNIVIQTPEVTLDCAGHAIRGPGDDAYSGGIDIAFADGVTVKNCTVTGFHHNGLFGHHSDGLRIEKNTFVWNGGHGLALDSLENSMAVGNTATDNGRAGPATGIIVTASTNVAVVGNTASGHKWAGILVSGTATSSVIGNRMTRNSGAMSLEHSRDLVVLRNTANLNTHGISVLHSTGLVLSGNIANGNEYEGVFVGWGSSGNTFTGNIVNGNFDGFVIDGRDPDGAGPLHGGCNRNVLSGNTARANHHFGFVVSSVSNYNTLALNTGLTNGFYDAWEEGTGTGDIWVANRFGTTDGI